MKPQTDLKSMLKTLSPRLNPGEFVFCTVKDLKSIPLDAAVMLFREEEGTSVILKREDADELRLDYAFIASWITLRVYSSLEAVGLTAAVASALAEEHIGCNMVAAFHHDHIFVKPKDQEKAMMILQRLSARHQS